MTMVDHTHDPDALSWVASAADTGTDFPIQNLPFGVFGRRGSGEAPRVGVAIGDLVSTSARARAPACSPERPPGPPWTARGRPSTR